MPTATPLLQRLLPRWPAKTVPHPLQTVLEQGALQLLYQPIVALQSGTIDGHEALVMQQKPQGAEVPQAVLDAGQLAQLQTELELAGMGRALQGWGYPMANGRLQVNLSAHTLVALSEPKPFQRLEGLFFAHRVPPKRVLVAIGQHRKLQELEALERCTTALQALGCTIALDDVKASQRSLDLWLRLKPALVKLDSRMTMDLKEDPEKAKVLRTLSQLAFKTGASLVAKGVDDADDLRIVRDAGVHLAQGQFLGFAAPAIVETLNLRARNVLAERWSAPDPQSQPGELVAAESGLQNLVGMRWFD